MKSYPAFFDFVTFVILVAHLPTARSMDTNADSSYVR